MRRLITALVFSLACSVAPAQDEQASPLLIELGLIMQYLEQAPGTLTLFACKKSLKREAEFDHWQELARFKGLNVDFIDFYGQEVTRERVVGDWQEMGFQRVVLVGTADEVRDFLETTGAVEWRPEFIVPRALAEDTLIDAPLDYVGDLVVASKDPIFEEGEGNVIRLPALQVSESLAEAQGLCETRRSTGSHLAIRRCWESPEARDRARANAQDRLKRFKRGNINRPVDEQPACVGYRAATGNC